MSETRAVQRRAEMLPQPLVGLVQQLVPDCNALLPADITTEQFRAALWLELTGRPALQACTPQSLRECIVKAATFGLLPGRDCHFLPFGNKKQGQQVATYVPNYQGIILALERTGKVRRAFAHPVHEGDKWEYDYFMDRPVHIPAVTSGKKQGPELFYYGAIQFRDNTFAVEIVTLEELEKIRRSSPAHESGPWVTWPDMMKRKSALKRVAKYVRLTPQLAELLDEDDARSLEDIPPARHQDNVFALFGDTATTDEALATARRGGGAEGPSVAQETRGDAGKTQDVTGHDHTEESIDRHTGELFDPVESAAIDASLAEEA